MAGARAISQGAYRLHETDLHVARAQVKHAQFSENVKSIENTIASLRCTEAGLSAELREISILLVLSEHAPDRSVAAAMRTSEYPVSPAHAHLIALVAAKAQLSAGAARTRITPLSVCMKCACC